MELEPLIIKIIIIRTNLSTLTKKKEKYSKF